MQIKCPQCYKIFEVSDELIPEKGRLLQCSSCQNKWFYKRNNYSKKDNPIENKLKVQAEEFIYDEDFKSNTNYKSTMVVKKKNIDLNLLKILKFFIVFVITLISLIIILDTFKNDLSKIIPNLNMNLKNLYESLKDIALFFKDLI